MGLSFASALPLFLPVPLQLFFFPLLISYLHQYFNLVHISTAIKACTATGEGRAKSRLAGISGLKVTREKAWLMLFMSVLEYTFIKDLLNLNSSPSNLLRGTV